MKTLIGRFKIEVSMFTAGVLVGAALARSYSTFAPLAEHSETVRILYLVLFPGIVGAWDFTNEMRSDWLAWAYYSVIPNGVAYAVAGILIHIVLAYGRTRHQV